MAKNDIEQFIRLPKYEVSLSAYQVPNVKEESWFFTLQVLSRKTKHKDNIVFDIKANTSEALKTSLIEITGKKFYQTYKDALQDGFGVLEYLGHGFDDKEHRIRFMINTWDKDKKDYNDEAVYFDGFDFYTER